MRHDLSSVLVTHDDGGIQESLLMSAGLNHFVEHFRTDLNGLSEEVDPQGLVELLGRMFIEEFEYEGRQLELQSDRELLVMAPQDVQSRIEAGLAAMEGALTSRVDLRVDVISLPGDGPAPFGGRCVIDESEISSLPTNSLRAHESYGVSLRPGRTGIVQRMEYLPLLVDYDVEIANTSVIHDPVVGEAEAGTRILMRGAPMADGLALSVFFTHGDALDEKPQTIDAPQRAYLATREPGSVSGTSPFLNPIGTADGGQEPRFIDVPSRYERHEITFRSAAFDTLLAPGKALVLSSMMQMPASRSEFSNKRMREVVIIRRVAGEMPALRRWAPEGSKREMIFLNAEAFSVPRTDIEGWISSSDHDAGSNKTPWLRAGFRDEPSVFLVDWVDSHFSTWRLVGPWIVCVYDPAWDGDALGKLNALLSSWRGENRVMTVELEGHADEREVATLRMPVRAGSQVSGMVGISTTTLFEYDVEVAQGAAAGDATVYPQFAGLAFVGRASELASGGAAIELQAALNHRRRAPVLVPIGGPLLTTIEKTAFELLRSSERIDFTPGLTEGARVLGDAGTTTSIKVAVR